MDDALLNGKMFNGVVKGESVIAQQGRERREDAAVNQSDLTHEGQRRINLIWETTQAIIALAVVAANLAVGVHVGFSPTGTKMEIPPMLTNSLFLVIGFYFSRTNHAAVGGVGPKLQSEYEGR